MANYIKRTNIDTIETTTSQTDMVKNFVNMTNNVLNMIENEGPIYTTWIKFQIGTKVPLVFDSSSTNPKENLIASLSYQKSGAGTTNTFKLDVIYDPFNMGQETADIVEQLDEYIATAMSYQDGDSVDNLMGKLQYGYNSNSDASLVSPEYSVIVAKSSSTVAYDTGFASYTFEGSSSVSIDCDSPFQYSAITGWKLMDIVEWTLYYWYGTTEHVPSHTGDGKPTDNIYKYAIDIPDDVYKNAYQTEINVEATQGKTPWEYVLNLLNTYPYNLTQAEYDSGEYDKTKSLNYAQTPKYILYITDDGIPTIRVQHVPAVVKVDSDGNAIGINESENLKTNLTLTWGLKDKNIICGWKPSADNRLYIIKKAQYIRANKQYENVLRGDTGNMSDEELKTALDNIVGTRKRLQEFYDAELVTLGIPSDVPIGATITILPRVLETVSRTAGVYMINSCTDSITSNGIYKSTFTLYRLRSVEDNTVNLELERQQEQLKQKMLEEQAAKQKVIDESEKSSGGGGTGSFGSGNGGGGFR